MKLLLTYNTNRVIYNLDLPEYNKEEFDNVYYTHVYRLEDLQKISDEFSELVTFNFDELDGEIIIWGVIED